LIGFVVSANGLFWDITDVPAGLGNVGFHHERTLPQALGRHGRMAWVGPIADWQVSESLWREADICSASLPGQDDPETVIRLPLAASHKQTLVDPRL
jgi:hypothetical protein